MKNINQAIKTCEANAKIVTLVFASLRLACYPAKRRLK